MGPMGHFGLSPGHDMSSMGMVRHGLSPGRHHPAGLSPVHHAEISRHNSIDERKSPLAPTLIMQVSN
jgi:hypothetical protein